jgi:hypothetical protein
MIVRVMARMLSDPLCDDQAMAPFVPDDFVLPAGLAVGDYRLEPLGPEHTDSDYAAWTSSIDHILATPGYDGASWPHEMTLAENRRDLEEHAADFAARTGFTFTVLAPDGETVVGCVYIYPSRKPDIDASVRSWVRAADATLDPVLYRAVRDWLAAAWPFGRIDYAPRPGV